MDFYYVNPEENYTYGVAIAPAGTDLFVLPEEGEVKNWQPIPLKLQDGTFCDFQANDLGCRVFSKRLKEIIEKEQSPDDLLQWLPITISSSEGEEREYYILHFIEGSDILDEDRSIFAAPEMVVKPVLSKQKTKCYRVVTFEGAGHARFFIAETVKDAIEKEEIIGIEFSKVAAY